MRETPLAQAEEFDYPCCKKCGGDLEWIDCWQHDCEDGWYDLHDEDPINYEPGDRARCNECDGNGGWSVCRACEAAEGKGDSHG